MESKFLEDFQVCSLLLYLERILRNFSEKLFYRKHGNCSFSRCFVITELDTLRTETFSDFTNFSQIRESL